jgi:hypothetical protein
LELDVAAWFRPTAGNFFSRIGKTAILDALPANADAPRFQFEARFRAGLLPIKPLSLR